MKQNRQIGFEFTMAREGARFTNIAGDRGGATKMGVTLGLMKRLNLDLDHDGDVDADDVRLVDRAVVEEIYFRVAWDAVRADSLAAGFDIEAADIAFNSFPAKWEQFVREGRAKTIEDITARRKEFYRRLAEKPGQAKFLQGWLNRADLAQSLALRLQGLDWEGKIE